MVVLCAGMALTRESSSERVSPEVSPATEPVQVMIRPMPEQFPPGTYMPRAGEGATSGSIDLETFSAGRDLVYVDDPRVWWESDHDKGDYEDDHSMHRSIAGPFSNLVELVCRRGGTLKVQDAYRSYGVHSRRSLHKEGRALDLTCDEMSMEELAKLCWAAGFDWIYNENGKSGAHIHCSVKRQWQTPQQTDHGNSIKK